MADLEISNLPAVTVPLAADALAMVNNGVTKQVTRAQIHTLELGEILNLPNGDDASNPEIAFPNSGLFEDLNDELAFSQGGNKVGHLTDAAAGGMFVNNTLTGGGLERVLTTSDEASFGEYQDIFDASVGTFPVTGSAGDWFNTTVAGTVDGQFFDVGDILVAQIDVPSTTVFAGNWSIVPNIGVSDHLLLINIGTNTHAQIDTHIALVNEHIDWTAAAAGTIHTDNYIENATHTGQVTGSGALALDVTAITAQPAAGALAGADTFIVNDNGVLSEISATDMGTFFTSAPPTQLVDGSANVAVIAQGLGVTAVRSVGNIDGEGRELEWQNSSGTTRASLGTEFFTDFIMRNHLVGGSLIFRVGTGGGSRIRAHMSGDAANGGFSAYAGTSSVPMLQTHPWGVEVGNGTLFLVQQAAPEADITSQGQLWVDSSDDALHYITEAGVDFNITAGLGVAEVNDLTSAVTWDNIPIANVPTGTSGSTVALGNHTHVASQITDFQAAVTANVSVAANTAKVSNATHTGDVTGSVALTIVAGSVTNLKLANMAANTVKVRIGSSGDPQDLGVPSNTVVGNFGAGVSAQQVATAQIAPLAVTYAKMQNIAANNVLLGNDNGAVNTPQELTGANVNLILPVFTSALNGLAPLSGGGSTNFLRADGSWAVPPGAGSQTPWTSNIDANGFDLNDGGVIFLRGQATANTDVPSQGQIWVGTTSDGELMFTDDQGLDMNISKSLYNNGTQQVEADALGLLVRDTLKVGALGSTTGVLKLGDQLNADADEAGYGQWWNTNDAPNVPMFTTDTGVDGTLARLEFAQNWTAAQEFQDSVELRFGTGNDYQLDFDGTDLVLNGVLSTDFQITGGVRVQVFQSGSSNYIGMTTVAGIGRVVGTATDMRMQLNGVDQFFIQSNTATGNTTGAQVKDHGALLHDVGFNDLQKFNDNVSDTLEARHAGHVAFKDATTARTLTLASNASLDFPVGFMTTVINAFTSGNYTITEGASTTLYYLDGATRTDTTGGAIVGPGGVANIWRESATVYYIWGTGITP